MKLVKLSGTDANGNTFDYGFDEPVGAAFGEITGYVADVLFGNSAIFDGMYLLTLSDGDTEYLVRRDFSADVTVLKNGSPLSPSAGKAFLANISGPTRHQWEIFNNSFDAEEFSADPAAFIKKFLSSLGFDEEEMLNKCEELELTRKTVLAQTDVLKELGVERTEEVEAERAVEDAERVLETAIKKCTLHVENVEKAKRAADIEDELKYLEYTNADVAEKADVVIADGKIAEELGVYDRILELRAERNQANSDIEALVQAITEDEAEIARLNAELNAKNEVCDRYDQQKETLISELSRMLAENAEKGELTAAATEKLGETKDWQAVNAPDEYLECDKKYQELQEKLLKIRADHTLKRSIREGAAFETLMDGKQEKLNCINSVIEREKKLFAEIEEEIAASKALLSSAEFEKLTEADAKRMKLFRSRILCETLQVDISAAEQKIRNNEEAKLSYREDVGALTAAKGAILEYMARCENNITKLSDKLISIKARLSVCKDVDEMEFGAVCPICKGRITDKAELSKENVRLSSSCQKYGDELANVRSSLTEYREKLEKINTRLGQLKERERFSDSYNENLRLTISAKQTALSAMLKEAEAKSVPKLETLTDNADKHFKELCENGADGTFINAHINYLHARLDAIAIDVEGFKEEADALATEIAGLKGIYDASLAPALEGQAAYDLLENAAAAEKEEDEIIAEMTALNLKKRELLEPVLAGAAAEMNDAHSNVSFAVNAVSEIIGAILADINKKDDMSIQLKGESAELNAALAVVQTGLESKVSSLRELTDRVEKADNAIKELEENTAYENISAEEVDILRARLLSEEDKNRLIAEIGEYNEKVDVLNAELKTIRQTLSEDDFDENMLSTARAEKQAAVARLYEVKRQNAVFDTVSELLEQKLTLCDRLKSDEQKLKMLSDGEIIDVVLPAINEILAEEGLSAKPDGLELAFEEETRKGLKRIDCDDIEKNLMAIAISCALNYSLRLASGHDLIRIVPLEKHSPKNAEKYGVITI